MTHSLGHLERVKRTEGELFTKSHDRLQDDIALIVLFLFFYLIFLGVIF